MVSKEAYIEKMKAQTNVWASQLSKFAADARNLAADKRIDFEKWLSRMEDHKKKLDGRMRDIDKTDESGWDSLRDEIDTSVEKLNDDINDFTKRFYD